MSTREKALKRWIDNKPHPGIGFSILAPRGQETTVLDMRAAKMSSITAVYSALCDASVERMFVPVMVMKRVLMDEDLMPRVTRSLLLVLSQGNVFLILLTLSFRKLMRPVSGCFGTANVLHRLL